MTTSHPTDNTQPAMLRPSDLTEPMKRSYVWDLAARGTEDKLDVAIESTWTEAAGQAAKRSVLDSDQRARAREAERREQQFAEQEEEQKTTMRSAFAESFRALLRKHEHKVDAYGNKLALRVPVTRDTQTIHLVHAKGFEMVDGIGLTRTDAIETHRRVRKAEQFDHAEPGESLEDCTRGWFGDPRDMCVYQIVVPRSPRGLRILKQLCSPDVHDLARQLLGLPAEKQAA